MISRIIENGLVKSGRRIKLLTHLTDRPGELRRFVSYIEEYKANIVYVYHEHAGRNLPIGQTQVEMDLETRDHAHAEILVAAMFTRLSRTRAHSLVDTVILANGMNRR